MRSKGMMVLGAVGLIGVVTMAANEPIELKRDATNYARAGVPVETVATEVGSGSTQCLTSEGGGSVCAVFAWDTNVNLYASGGDATCCLTQQLAATIGAQAAETKGRITVGSAVEDCAGYPLADRIPHDFVPRLESLRSRRFQTTGRYCKTPVLGFGGESVHAPCSADADCGTLGGSSSTGECQSAGTSESKGGAIILCRATATTLVNATVER